MFIRVDTVLLLGQVELPDMLDLYLPPVLPSDLVECRPERKEGAEGEKGEDHQHDDDFRALRECFEPDAQPLVLPVRPIVDAPD